MTRQRINLLVRLILSVGLLVLLFALVDRQTLLNAFLSMDLPTFLLGLVFFIGAMSIWSVRWFVIVKSSGEPTNLRQVFSTTLVGMFFSMFLPTLGSDVARMYELSTGGPNARVVSTVLLDRVIGLISLVLTAVVGLAIGYQVVGTQDSRVTLLIVVVLVGLVVGWVVFFNERVMRHFRWVFKLPLVNRVESGFRSLYAALQHLRSQPRLLLTALAISFAMQITEIISVILISRALNLQVSPLYFFIFVPIIWVVTMIPLSISGLGLREGAFWFFFSQVGVASSDAVALSLLYYSYRLIVGVIGGLIFLRDSINRIVEIKPAVPVTKNN